MGENLKVELKCTKCGVLYFDSWNTRKIIELGEINLQTEVEIKRIYHNDNLSLLIIIINYYYIRNLRCTLIFV